MHTYTCIHVTYLEVGQRSTIGKNLQSASYNTQHVLKSAHIQGLDGNLLVSDIIKTG